MAEFKLGRIRFVWKGAWVTATTYYKDDVVRLGGKVYICQIGHTASTDFNTDLDINPTKWNLMSDGQRWTGDWTTSTAYQIGDLAKYGGIVYICTDNHTSAATATLGLENNSAVWNQFIEGFDWKGNWTTSTRYKFDDIVRYGGINYVCITGHTSAATDALGLENGSANWQVFSQGQEYLGTWVTATRYKLNDIVKWGAGLWICTTQHSAAAAFPTDAAYWAQYNEGFEFEGTWSSGTAYQQGDVVSYGGNRYVSKSLNTAANPLTSTSDWDLFSEGLSYQNDWTNSTSYKIGQVVKYGGNNYLATTDSPSTPYTVTAVTAANDRFTIATTTGIVVGMTVRFTGTTIGGVFTTGRYYVKTVAAGYITVSTTSGGTTFNITADAAGSMTATVSAEPPNTAYWTDISRGFNWRDTWSDDAEYNVGDTVRHGANAYICVLSHRAEGDDGSTVGEAGGGQALSRPDLDAAGTYWNVVTVGSETSVLTTTGDMVYYGGAGPTRLPVGTEGQVLRVSAAGIPEWVTYGSVDHVYYVSTSGEDRPYPDCGATIDKPWQTIRYACEQVEYGARNPNARYLLELNRVFIQKEITAWIRTQIAAATIGQLWYNFDYDEYKCERDVGFIIDRVIWDIGHGGNLKIRAAAFSLLGAFGEAGEFSAGEESTPYITLAAEADEGVASYQQLKLLVADVLANEVPTTIYQTFAADSTAIVTQYINTDYVAETGITTTTDELIDIIITALVDQDTDALPARRIPNNTINIKTGQYRETLPIIVPAETALVGDEKRSVNAGPAGSLINRDDAKYSIGALGRLETVVGQIILGTNVTESTGNTATQSALVPFASSVEETTVKRLIRTIQHQIDFKIGTTVLETVTNPTDYNTTFLSGFGDARTLLRENKEFLKDEITAYIAVNYPAVKYSKTKCRRDIGFIVDAVCYDITYGGSYQTLTAGLAYFDGGASTDLQIDSTEIAATADSYSRLKTVMQQIIANTTVTKSTGNAATQWTDSTNLTTGSSANATIGTLIDIIINIIQGDSTASTTPQINVTTIASLNTLTSIAHGLAVGDAVVPRTTANGLTNGTKYWVVTVATADTFQLAATYGGAVLASFTNGASLDIDLEVIDYPTATNLVTSTTALITAAVTLDAAQETIVTAATAYIVANYPALVYNSAKCERDVRLILEAVMFDFMFNSNSLTRTAAYSYLRSTASDVFSLSQKTATRAAFSYVATLAAANVGGNATAQARISTLMILLDDIVYGATNDGSICQTEIRAADYARLQLERNRDYIVAEITAYGAATYTTTVTISTAATDVLTCADTSWMQRNAPIRFTGTAFGDIATATTYYIQNVVSSTTFKIATTRNSNTAFDVSAGTGTMTVSLYYPVGECERDVNAYIDALKFDLQYPGNYRSRLAARYYANAVMGSLEEDMYYLRNGTGVRNQTLQGLTGDLLAENAYGTSRVSAGAYCSLDPGWGPADFRTWIIQRSPYVQNVATFGYAAVGQKIDGSLHNGGNKSIVSNDFTQVISDGIGAWIINDARAELVSVFSYYAHIGYLAEAGGRVRATNGNNSYGDFGSVAEGFDAAETPILCEVDNNAGLVTVGNVLTDNINYLWGFEYDNAGTDYTRVTWSVTGGGTGVSVEHDDFRDDAVYTVRLLDNVDDSTLAPEEAGNYGGFGYISNANTAQSGTTTELTIAAVDDEITGAYVGMKLLLTGGTGAGQVGIVASYTSGTKVATVTKESTGGAGWDHVVPGTPIVSPDASTTYVLEPAISFTAPTYSSTSRTLGTAQSYSDATYAPTVAVYSPISTTTSGTGTGATFTVVRRGTKYSAVVIVSAGTGYTRLDTLTLAGTSLGGASTTNNITITVTAVSTAGVINAFEFTGFGAGGKFAAIASGSRTTNTSTNGTTWSENLLALPSTSNWTSMAVGKLTVVETAGAFVIGRAYVITNLGNTVFTNIGAAGNLVGTYFVATGAGSGTGTATPVANHLVAVSNSTTVNAYSTDGGTTWTAGGALPGALSGQAVGVAYGTVNGAARWVVIGFDGTTCYSANGGVSWTVGATTPGGSGTSIAYGQGVWIVVSSLLNTTAYSADGGVTWTAGGTLPSSSAWSGIAYGANKFVVVASDGSVNPVWSVNKGLTWSSTGVSGYIGSGTTTRVNYGQGVFVVTQSSSNNMSSSQDGVVWTTRAITRASGTGALEAVHGNPSQTGIWAIIPSASTTAASSAVLGATAKARAYVAENKIYAIRVTDPGSAYTSAPTITITDPNNLYEAPTTVYIGKGACANVSFINRGTAYDSAIAEVDTGDGYASGFQSGVFVAVRKLTGIPEAGANVVFATQPNTVYKLVQVISQSGSFDGGKRAFFRISPSMSVFNSPADGTAITTRILYSQVRLTGHDFLNIGTGNFVETNYPGTPTQGIEQLNETVDNNGGRVFYTSTDQDGNFRVGELFVIEQATGRATLNADAFNIAGLSELSLGNITLGGNSATVTEFSTDPFLTANSDNVVSTQRAVKAYIAAQIGGGGASLNVNSIVAGFVEIAGTQITTTTGGTIQMKANFNFQGGVRGYPVAWNYFLN